MAAVAGAPRAVAAAGTAIRVEVAAAQKVAAAPVVPTVVATVAVANLMAAVGKQQEGPQQGGVRHVGEWLTCQVCQVLGFWP